MDRALTSAALAFGAVSLLYPFGGDQGLYFYVGREWLQGAIPYRDAMEQKTPLIFLLHAVLVFLTGPNMWAIRAAELGWILWLGAAVADLATPAGQPRGPGVLGVSRFAMALFYFGLFDYWDTAQCEIWYAGLALLSLRAVARRPPAAATWLRAGLLGGLAVLMKPPGVVLLAAPILVLLQRAGRAEGQVSLLRARAVALLVFVAAAAAPATVTAIYFASVGGLGDLIDVALRANYHDMVHSSVVSGVSPFLDRLGDFPRRAAALLPVVMLLMLLGASSAPGPHPNARFARHPLARYGLALLLMSTGVAAVALQRKFYGYHWSVLAPLLAFAVACAVHDLGVGTGMRTTWRSAAVSAVVAGVLVLGLLTTEESRRYWRTLSTAGAYLAGSLGRSEFLAVFEARNNTPYADQEIVGRWIAANSSAEDTLAVRGFEQVVYAVADRRAPTRFFWTRWLTEPRRAYRRREWLAEDRAALLRNPPRYVVVSERARRGSASQKYFRPLGYVERFRSGRLIVLGRDYERLGVSPR